VTRPYEPAFLDALESLRLGEWVGTVWRGTIGNIDPLVPNSRGARWNPPDVDALYCAMTAVGAEAEMASVMARQSVPIKRPLRTHRLSIHLSDVIDLREPGALSTHGYSLEVLTDVAWDVPQRLGGAGAWLGIGGLIVPSARHSDGNLVVYVANLAAGDMVEVVDHGEDGA